MNQQQAGKNITYRRPWLYPKQLEAMFHEERFGCIEASTKSGKTVSGICWLAEQAMKSKPNRNFWWVAPIFPQADIAFRRMSAGIPLAYRTTNKSNLTITLPNKAVIWFKSADDPDSLYGEDVYACVIDEASRVREASWYAIRTTLTATRGPIRMIGNVKGRRNWFFALCRKAEAGEPGMKYSKLIAADAVAAGILSADEIADAKSKLPPEVFKELYLAEPADDGGNPFGMKAIEDCFLPQSPGTEPMIFGVDLAKSVDWTWVIGLDEENRASVSERWQGPWDVTKNRLVEMIGNKPALIDSTGVGDPIVEDLQKQLTEVEGFKFTAQSKQQIMEGLAADLHQRAFRYSDPRLRAELECFEYEYTRTGVRYTAPQGYNDDGVCALALARQKARTGVGGILSLYG
jgi:hypothetical protein